MSVPGPSLPGPQRASRKGPNPFLLIGIFFASSITFLTLTKKKQNEAEARGQKPARKSIIHQEGQWNRVRKERKKFAISSDCT
ncbi:hypothetical protein L204_103945 [Cryptococcus depauperatus]